jgi:hypothetical protein
MKCQPLSAFAAKLRRSILSGFDPAAFDDLAVELFALQYEHNAAYRPLCYQRKITPSQLILARTMTPTEPRRWAQVPFVPTAAFKDLVLSSLRWQDCTTVFHSSGTTGQLPSQHFHSPESLLVYEASLWKWFQSSLGPVGECLFLTPPPNDVPHSSLVHMFETVRQMSGLPESTFTGTLSSDDTWQLGFAATLNQLQAAVTAGKPLTLLGTAFSFVHLLDHLAENQMRFELPPGSRAMETGGYKNRSRVLPKAELHALITKRLGVTPDNIICEYGMSELSSQAYTVRNDQCPVTRRDQSVYPAAAASHFHFPPWARVQLISPETGREVAEGETGLIRIFDLANVFSVAAIQTEDLGIRRGDGFELVGRAQLAEPRGCSLMNQ